MSDEIKPDTKTPPVEAEEPQISLDELDDLLNQEDPSFHNQFGVLRDEKFEVDIEVENFSDVDEVISHPVGSPTATKKVSVVNRLASGTANFFKDFRNNCIKAITGFLPFVFSLISSFFSMPFRQKSVVVIVVALTLLLIVIVQRALTGSILPSFELQFISSFKNVADRSFKVEDGEQVEDFDSPLRHPDYVVLIERLVVNLRPSAASENPMGMFEFYIEASSQEGAIEINERQKEIRDAMARTIEISTYDDLSAAEGKDRMKLSLRREVNTLLTQGRVRRVFFKTVILKP